MAIISNTWYILYVHVAPLLFVVTVSSEKTYVLIEAKTVVDIKETAPIASDS